MQQDRRWGSARLASMGAAVCVLAACAVPGGSAPEQAMPAGFVHLAALVPDAVQDMRYHGSKNFLGRPVAAYEAATCILSAPAAQALQYGLVNAVLDTPEAATAAALQCAAEIATKPPIAQWGTKQALHYARDHSTEDALKQMGWLQGAIWSNRHVMEAVMAMKAKRSGDFPALKALHSFQDLA